MKRSIYLAMMAAALALATAPGWARSPRPKSPQATDTARGATAVIDPDAIAALNRMGDYLRTLKTFQVRASTSTDDVLEDGEKIQYEANTDYLAQLPNRLRVEMTADDLHRVYLYDGKNLTVLAVLLNYYATVPAPATVGELMEELDEKYDIELPLVDLFYWGGPKSGIDKIKSATVIGPSTVEGTTCEQYAFRQDGLDWQGWIQLGDYPLPRKLVLTTLTDEARPQHIAVLTWNLAPSFNEATFTFDPPTGARKIVLAAADAGSGNR